MLERLPIYEQRYKNVGALEIMIPEEESENDSLVDDILAAIVDQSTIDSETFLLCSDMARGGQCAYRRNEDGSIRRIAPNVVYVNRSTR